MLEYGVDRPASRTALGCRANFGVLSQKKPEGAAVLCYHRIDTWNVAIQRLHQIRPINAFPVTPKGWMTVGLSSLKTWKSDPILVPTGLHFPEFEMIPAPPEIYLYCHSPCPRFFYKIPRHENLLREDSSHTKSGVLV